MRSPSAADSSSPVSLIPSPSRSSHRRPSGFSITSMTAGSSSQAAIDGPSAVRSIRAPRDFASDRIGWTVKTWPLKWTGRTAARRQKHIKRARNSAAATASRRRSRGGGIYLREADRLTGVMPADATIIPNRAPDSAKRPRGFRPSGSCRSHSAGRAFRRSPHSACGP